MIVCKFSNRDDGLRSYQIFFKDLTDALLAKPCIMTIIVGIL